MVRWQQFCSLCTYSLLQPRCRELRTSFDKCPDGCKTTESELVQPCALQVEPRGQPLTTFIHWTASQWIHQMSTSLPKLTVKRRGDGGVRGKASPCNSKELRLPNLLKKKVITFNASASCVRLCLFVLSFKNKSIYDCEQLYIWWGFLIRFA